MQVDIDLLLSRIGPGDRVLDLGGWDKVFPRANVVVDLNPYETRRRIYPNISEHFGREDWIIADLGAWDFWRTIRDKEFDFITIGHTLEDIRDPLFVCSQMVRCGKAGYFEVPARFRECAKTSSLDTFSGYDHHRWIVEAMDDNTGMIFKAKLSWAHHEDFLGGDHRYLLDEATCRVDGYFWVGSFNCVEHFPKGTALETADLWHYFHSTIRQGMPRKNIHYLTPDSTSPFNGKCLWVDQYFLKSELEPPLPPTPMRRRAFRRRLRGLAQVQWLRKVDTLVQRLVKERGTAGVHALYMKWRSRIRSSL